MGPPLPPFPRTLMQEEQNIQQPARSAADYTEKNIRTLEGAEHIRRRPGMYIGRLGDGSHAEDGIYVLLKEVVDNSIDEFRMGAGKRIDIEVDEQRVSVRDYGRGIPLGKLIEAVSMLNTGGKYDTKAFKKSVGLNGVGAKAVNALSARFEVRSVRDGEMRTARFERGDLVSDEQKATDEENGTYIAFEPDATLFTGYRYHSEFVETLLRNYTYLNAGLAIYYNGRRIVSRNGLVDLLNDNMTNAGLYPIVHLVGEDIEIAFILTQGFDGTHGEQRVVVVIVQARLECWHEQQQEYTCEEGRTDLFHHLRIVFNGFRLENDILYGILHLNLLKKTKSIFFLC